MESISELIARIPLFKGLSQKQIEDISRITLKRNFRKGQAIFSEGDIAGGFYVSLKGRVKIFKLSSEGKEQILHIIGSGEPFGEAAVFAGTNFPAHAEALEENEALFFPRNGFIEVIKKDPSVSMNLLAILSIRLKQFTLLVENLSLKEVPQRLAAFLLYFPKSSDKSEKVKLEITKGQLASMLGTIPETLSRILNKMANQGFIQVQGRQITILDRRALEDLVSRGNILV